MPWVTTWASSHSSSALCCSSERVSRPVAPSRTWATSPEAGATKAISALSERSSSFASSSTLPSTPSTSGGAGDGLGEPVEPLEVEVSIREGGVGAVGQQQTCPGEEEQDDAARGRLQAGDRDQGDSHYDRCARIAGDHAPGEPTQPQLAVVDGDDQRQRDDTDGVRHESRSVGAGPLPRAAAAGALRDQPEQQYGDEGVQTDEGQVP